MAFINDTNRKRVAKIMETLELISKSGNSNGADREDFQELLEPLIRAMAELSPAVGHPSDVPAEKEEPADDIHPNRRHPRSCGDRRTAPRWADVNDMVHNATLDELTSAMIIYMARISDELHDKSS